MTITRDDAAAIAVAVVDEIERRQRQTKVPAETAADSNIVYADGGLVATEASEALLPGVRFALALAKDRFSEIGQAVIRLNCGYDENWEKGEHFGQLFAQSDSVHTNPLQNMTSPIVFDVKWSAVVNGYVLDRTRTMRRSADQFPDAFACVFTSWAQLTEWCRLTREDWLSRGWVPGR